MATKTVINIAGPTQGYFPLSDSTSLIVIYFPVTHSNYVEIENQDNYHGIHQHAAENYDIGYLFSRHLLLASLTLLALTVAQLAQILHQCINLLGTEGFAPGRHHF